MEKAVLLMRFKDVRTYPSGRSRCWYILQEQGKYWAVCLQGDPDNKDDLQKFWDWAHVAYFGNEDYLVQNREWEYGESLDRVPGGREKLKTLVALLSL